MPDPRQPYRVQLAAVDAGVDHGRPGPQCFLQPSRPVVRHGPEKARYAAHELLQVKPGVEDQAVRGQGGGEVGEAEVHVGSLPLRNGVAQLVFMEVDYPGTAGDLGDDRHQLRQAHHVRRQQAVGLRRGGPYLSRQGEVGSPHPPFPEAGGEGDELHLMGREGGEAVREEAVGAAVEGFDEEHSHVPEQCPSSHRASRRVAAHTLTEAQGAVW